MEIASVETFCTKDVGMVRVRTAGGAEVWAQVSPYRADFAATVFHRPITPHALANLLLISIGSPTKFRGGSTSFQDLICAVPLPDWTQLFGT